MLAEVIVISVCLQQQGGCSESTSAYYKYNKEVQTLVESVEKVGQRLITGNEWLIYIATPIASIASGKPANFYIKKGLMLGIDARKELVMLQWSY